MLTVGQRGASSATYFDVILLALQLGVGILAAGLLFKYLRRRARIVPPPLRPAVR